MKIVRKFKIYRIIQILSMYGWLLVILTSCSTTCCFSSDSSRTTTGTSANSSGEKMPLNTTDTCIEGADEDADMMAVPPAPFIDSESVPGAGCMSDVNSSVLRDRYLQQHHVKHIYFVTASAHSTQHSFQCSRDKEYCCMSAFYCGKVHGTKKKHHVPHIITIIKLLVSCVKSVHIMHKTSKMPVEISVGNYG